MAWCPNCEAEVSVGSRAETYEYTEPKVITHFDRRGLPAGETHTEVVRTGTETVYFCRRCGSTSVDLGASSAGEFEVRGRNRAMAGQFARAFGRGLLLGPICGMVLVYSLFPDGEANMPLWVVAGGFILGAASFIGSFAAARDERALFYCCRAIEVTVVAGTCMALFDSCFGS